MTDREFLMHQVESLTDGISVQHPDKCGQCHKQRLNGRLARRILALKTLPDGVLRIYSEMSQRIWKHSKYSRFMAAKLESGVRIGPALAAMKKEMGWEP